MGRTPTPDEIESHVHRVFTSTPSRSPVDREIALLLDQDGLPDPSGTARIVRPPAHQDRWNASISPIEDTDRIPPHREVRLSPDELSDIYNAMRSFRPEMNTRPLQDEIREIKRYLDVRTKEDSSQLKTPGPSSEVKNLPTENPAPVPEKREHEAKDKPTWNLPRILNPPARACNGGVAAVRNRSEMGRTPAEIGSHVPHHQVFTSTPSQSPIDREIALLLDQDGLPDPPGTARILSLPVEDADRIPPHREVRLSPNELSDIQAAMNSVRLEMHTQPLQDQIREIRRYMDDRMMEDSSQLKSPSSEAKNLPTANPEPVSEKSEHETTTAEGKSTSNPPQILNPPALEYNGRVISVRDLRRLNRHLSRLDFDENSTLGTEVQVMVDYISKCLREEAEFYQ